jgi:CHAD domain-containing protein
MQGPGVTDALKLRADPAGLDGLSRMLATISTEDLRCSLRETATAGEAFQAIAASRLYRFARSEDLLARTGSADALHQVRVALRQLRSALSIFREVVADERYEHLRDELRWLAQQLNEARDLDTLIARMDKPPATLASARKHAYAQAAKALASARAQRVTHDLVDWLVNGVWLEVRNPADLTAARFASASLARLRRKLGKKGRHLRALDDSELHEVRIAAKKLRYAAEFFSGLFPGDKSRRREERFAKAIRALQDELGELQDARVAPEMLERLQVARADWPSFTRRKKLVERAATRLDRVLERKPFWR